MHVPPTDILRFREKRKDERNQFLNAIKALRNELAQADAPEVIEAIINDEKKKLILQRMNIEKYGYFKGC